MNKHIMRMLGFEDAVKKMENGQCVFCNEKVDLEKIENELDLKEFKISGICPKCQVEAFKEPEEISTS